MSAFVIGATVRTNALLNVRATPAIPSVIVGVANLGSTGIIVDGPVLASGHTWWKMDYRSGADGWSAEAFLAVVAPPPPKVQMITILYAEGKTLTFGIQVPGDALIKVTPPTTITVTYANGHVATFGIVAPADAVVQVPSS